MNRRVLAALVFAGLLVAVLPSWKQQMEDLLRTHAPAWRWMLHADLDARTRLAFGDDYDAWRLVAEHVPASCGSLM